MVYDDIIIGSGISALGAAFGLEGSRRTLVLAGPAAGTYSHYSGQLSAPCAYLGAGGLGNDWHGVIPFGLHARLGAVSDADFEQMFSRFYPHTALAGRLGRAQFFVPWQPIRPQREFARLVAARAGRLIVATGTVKRFAEEGGGVRVETLEGTEHSGRRLWIAAGAVHTPGLLERSLGVAVSRRRISDHAVCYVGLVEGDVPPPRISRTRDGVTFEAFYDDACSALYTLRPARFAFRRLDYGFEQRAVFGMPTGSIVSKLLRRFSPGLLAEAFYNRAGVFPRARIYSVYAQTLVPDAYALEEAAFPLRVNGERIVAATAQARARAPFAGIRQSCRPELYIPGIHLHHSVDSAALVRAGIGGPAGRVQVVDASVLSDIGPDHHSFKLLLLARARAALS